ncbi:nickel pincer cofactor biosynthesis protein LarB [Proteinivorax tanatarense]|uniref:Nickel pincer cofactor biosynthesis protein LarB n=1 Tax=Proteinivorax tanatarense TaxID=1260629 RepID=A0AAU7VM40_9FIRM
MDKNKLSDLFNKVKDGEVSVDDAVDRLKGLPFDDLGFAKVDNHRNLRQGYPEVVFCQSKTVEQVVAICENIAQKGNNVLATRATPKMYEAVKGKLSKAKYNKMARVITIENEKVRVDKGYIAVVTGGTSDMAVAEEAAETAIALGNEVRTVYDAGVAGIHRLFANLETIQGARVVIAVAGMEGALASVVGGLVDKPVIAVPTSVGYGANFNGLSALLTMLNSCSSGVSVVNIDNGFGAGYLASMINRM